MSKLTTSAAAIQTMAGTVKRLRAQQALVRKHRAIINSTARKATIKGLTASVWCQVSTDYPPEVEGGENPPRETISVGFSLYGLEGLKSPAFMKLLSHFVDADLTHTKDYPASLNRDYSFWYRLPDNVWLKVCVYAYVKEDSPTCRKVLVKSEQRLVTDETYKIVCD